MLIFILFVYQICVGLNLGPLFSFKFVDLGSDLACVSIIQPDLLLNLIFLLCLDVGRLTGICSVGWQFEFCRFHFSFLVNYIWICLPYDLIYGMLLAWLNSGFVSADLCYGFVVSPCQIGCVYCLYCRSGLIWWFPRLLGVSDGFRRRFWCCSVSFPQVVWFALAGV